MMREVWFAAAGICAIGAILSGSPILWVCTAVFSLGFLVVQWSL